MSLNSHKFENKEKKGKVRIATFLNFDHISCLEWDSKFTSIG